MFRWNLLLRKVFASRQKVRRLHIPRLFEILRVRLKAWCRSMAGYAEQVFSWPDARLAKQSVKPSMEELTERIVPSASALSSPPVADATSQMVAMIEQWTPVLVTWENELSQIEQAIIQKFAQELAVVQQQLGHLLGMDTSSTNPSTNTVVSPPASSSGNSNSSSSNKLAPIVRQNGGDLTDSGSSNITRTTSLYAANTLAQPFTSGSTPNSGSPLYSTAYATVSGQVWQDNNGDGIQESGEVGMSGITVYLDTPSGSEVMSTTTDANGNYQFQVTNSLYNLPQQFEIQVVLPSYFEGTIQGTDSNINASGYSPVFTLEPNGAEVVPAGLRSMVVTTTQDDANGPIAGQTTLRDAIETGDNGGGPQVTFAPNVTGTISLQAALPAITTSYNIVGPGSSYLTVQGNGDSENPYSILTVNSGVTSTISGLTITGGSGSNGGAIDNNGNLALNSAIIEGNTTSGNGGAIYNGNFATTLTGDQILGNTAAAGGGVYNGGGTLTIIGGTVIKSNKAQDPVGGHGGGIYNASGTVTVSGNTVINTNSAAVTGGGVDNLGTFYMTGGEISGNTAPPTTGGGGGVDNGGSMRLLGVQVQTNSAGQGGGIFTARGILVLAQDTMISGNNYASLGGGGLWLQSGTATMVGGGVTNNTAQVNGGGVYVNSGQLLWRTGALVSGNTAIGNTNGSPNGGGYGGGIYIKAGQVTVSSGTIRYNTAASMSGGGIYNYGGTLTLDHSVNITDNSANNQGGGIYLAGTVPSTTTFDGVTVSGNKTLGNQQTTGWGVYQQNGANVTIQPNGLTDKDDPNGTPVTGA